ncbi:3-hydroxyacyl-CoA dehydrogenase NAD-binding domain-containing protein [Defluviimonas sp. SAOS-178_SWC]|uniref:3-hydroxyacyl-CoA dehydrogenase NAD-binding domain-containing protein n=1 Tax=Defluviimonas sp. SAOS-178_SWC TaxID=3121287 RepID=UPI0032219C5A
MTEEVRTARSEGIATITLDNPPVNALGTALRAEVMAAFDSVSADPSVRVIILAAAGRTWPAGADIREFGHPPAAPELPDLCDAVARSAKPVIAALHGTVLGGGLELALAAGVRVAEPGTTLGLPEVSLGIPPGGGATQRLPRLIGAKPALGLMLSGLPIAADRALDLRLVDAVSEGAAATAAEGLARAYLAGTAELPTAAERGKGRGTDADAWLSAVSAARAGLGNPRLPAPGRIIDCVEAALLLPEDEGFAFERTAFAELVATPEAAALRHAFLAERRAMRQPDLDRISPREIHRAGVAGGGQMGAGIAVALLGAGLPVTLVERDPTALAAGLGRVATIHERAVEKGRLTPEAREAEWDRISGATDIGALATADLIVEAVTEDEALKTELFAGLGRVAKRNAVLATSTSHIDVNRLAAAASRPEDVVGLHFLAPAQATKLLEVVVGAGTAPEVTATGFALARRLGKIAVRSGVCDGFIGNRILTAYRTAMDFLLEDGASPYEIDRAMRDFGFPLGPYQGLDLAGLDISWARRRRLSLRRDPARRYVAIGDRLCEAGRLGQKAGKGYYLYPEGGRKGAEDPEVLQLIAAERQAKGLIARKVGAAEIQRRALAAMANEGARLLDAGIARCPSDIDVVMLAGFGFPRWRGGPMMAADQAGLLEIRNELRDFAREEEAFWRPAEIWAELIKNGRRFADLNGI